jgi:hypothetical protein
MGNFREILEHRSTDQLINDINLSFTRNYLSPFVIKNAIETTIHGNIPIIDYISWGLKARGVFDNDPGTRHPSATLLAAYELGIIDGRVKSDDCMVNGQLDLFLIKKNTLLFLCEYGDEIIYSRLVLHSGKQIDLRTVLILEACCPDLMHSEIRIFSNIRTKLLQSLVELQGGGDVSGRRFIANKVTKAKIAELERFQAETLQRNSIDVSGCLKITFENGKFVHKGNTSLITIK